MAGPKPGACAAPYRSLAGRTPLREGVVGEDSQIQLPIQWLPQPSDITSVFLCNPLPVRCL